MEYGFNFSNLAIEAMYQRTKEQAMKNGLMISREEFWRTPGQVMIFPSGYEQLMRAGVTDMAYQQAFGRPADPLQMQRSGRK